jgi:hypothetical protein
MPRVEQRRPWQNLRRDAMDLVGRYLSRGHAVEGWLEPFSARAVAALAAAQRAHAISGASAEIGIHHGRLFILLHLAGAGARDLAIDVFGDQHLNVDCSGRGDREVFLRNLVHWGGDPARVEILQRSSLDVTPEEIANAVGPVTMFSIDGGHTAECAENDLRLAEKALHPRGLIILDDYFNQFWPEVCLGANAYLQDPETTFRPFALTAGKMFLCRPNENAFYREEMRRRLPRRAFDKEVAMFGQTVQLMGFAYAAANLAIRLRWAIGDTRLGAVLKARRQRNLLVGAEVK